MPRPSVWRLAPMACARLAPPATGLGLWVLASGLLAGLVPAMAADFPGVEELREQAEMPSPLVMFDGRPVTSPEEWFARRRPELKALFSHYMYGKTPPRPEGESFAIARDDRAFLDGEATLREVTITIGPPGVPKIHLLLVVPNARGG